MSTRLLRSLILPLLALPALFGCAEKKQPVAPPQQLSEAALAAVDPRPGVSRERLARRVDALFSDKDAGETRAVLVLRGGRVIAQRYAEGYGPQTRLPGWSMSKTITAVMIGLLVSDGRLRLDDPAPIPSWQRPGDPRGEITLRHLLQMSSGLRHTEAGEPLYESDEVRMLFMDGRDNMADHAEAQPLEAEPGAKFEYSSATTVILADLATRALTSSTDPQQRRLIAGDYLRTRVLEPLGMRTAVPEFDAAGTFIGSSMVLGTAQDWANLGEFLRNGGAVKGAQLLPLSWIEFMTTPSPRNPGYGAQLWLNRRQVDNDSVLFPGSAPANVFACVGHLGQYVVVSPNQELTIVRLGKSDKDQRVKVRGYIADIIKLFPDSQ
jgi:CubicO group peptidase (beta-lactamase class C family)